MAANLRMFRINPHIFRSDIRLELAPKIATFFELLLFNKNGINRRFTVGSFSINLINFGFTFRQLQQPATVRRYN